MRRIVGALSLGIMLGTASFGVDDRPPAQPERDAAATRDGRRDAVEERPGWVGRLIPALQRLRLNPGPDHGERAAASSLRP